MITTIVLIKADPKRIPDTAREIAGIEGVQEVYSVSGEWDLVAIVRVAEYQDIAEVVTERFPAVTDGVPRVLAQGPRAGVGHWRRLKRSSSSVQAYKRTRNACSTRPLDRLTARPLERLTA